MGVGGQDAVVPGWWWREVVTVVVWDPSKLELTKEKSSDFSLVSSESRGVSDICCSVVLSAICRFVYVSCHEFV